MNLGHDSTYRKIWSLVSWRSPEDPAPGSFTLDLKPGTGDLVISQGSKPYWTGTLHDFENRTGYYPFVDFPYVSYVTWSPLDDDISRITHMVLDAFGQLIIQSWSEDDQSWRTVRSSKCSYRRRGAFSVCNIMAEAKKPCTCLRGFKPALSKNNLQTSDQGCVRKTNL